MWKIQSTECGLVAGEMPVHLQVQGTAKVHLSKPPYHFHQEVIHIPAYCVMSYSNQSTTPTSNSIPLLHILNYTHACWYSQKNVYTKEEKRTIHPMGYFSLSVFGRYCSRLWIQFWFYKCCSSISGCLTNPYKPSHIPRRRVLLSPCVCHILQTDKQERKRHQIYLFLI